MKSNQFFEAHNMDILLDALFDNWEEVIASMSDKVSDDEYLKYIKPLEIQTAGHVNNGPLGVTLIIPEETDARVFDDKYKALFLQAISEVTSVNVDNIYFHKESEMNLFMLMDREEYFRIRAEIVEEYVSKALADYHRSQMILPDRMEEYALDLARLREIPLYDFSDETLAAIVVNSSHSEDDQLVILKRFAEEISCNEKLKQEISDWANEVSEKRKSFYNTEFDCFYSLELYDEGIRDYFGNGNFLSAAMASEAGKQYGVEYKITKHRMMVQKREMPKSADDYINSELGMISFASDGKTAYSWSKEVSEEFITKNEAETFRGMYQGIRHPFRAGDLIRKDRNGEIIFGIITGPNDDAEMDADIERFRSFADFSDERVGVETMDKDGHFWCEPELVYELEYASFEEMPEEQRNLFMAASDLYKGKGCIETYDMYKEDYVKSHF